MQRRKPKRDAKDRRRLFTAIIIQPLQEDLFAWNPSVIFDCIPRHEKNYGEPHLGNDVPINRLDSDLPNSLLRYKRSHLKLAHSSPNQHSSKLERKWTIREIEDNSVVIDDVKTMRSRQYVPAVWVRGQVVSLLLALLVSRNGSTRLTYVRLGVIHTLYQNSVYQEVPSEQRDRASESFCGSRLMLTLPRSTTKWAREASLEL